MREHVLFSSLPTPRSVFLSATRRLRRRVLPGLLIVAVLVGIEVAPDFGIELSSGTAAAQAVPACGLAQAAFCEPFSTPSVTANTANPTSRSGNLDGVLWGVSRATSNDNPAEGMLYQWSGATRTACGFTQAVGPEQDITICNGQMAETVNDGGNVTELAAYPRQPFDISGRTGVAAFDVNNDTEGPHAAWPAFVYTDQPVPAPYSQAAGLADNPRNSFGFSLASPNCDGTLQTTGVDTMWTTNNYQLNMQSFTTVGCVQKATDTTHLNHFEVHINQSHVEVWGTDPGATNLHELAFGNFNVPLSRGLVWIADVHYNADKFNNQANHTFVWRNVGFDGPVLARDLGFDVLDASHSGTSGGNLGYLVPTGGQLTVQIPNVNGVQNASAALFEFTWWPHDRDSITYSVNGHAAHTQPWPYGGAPLFVSQTLAVPVPLNEVQTGTNTVVLSSTDSQLGGVSVANLDLILVGAAGMPGGGPTPTPVPNKTATATSTAIPPTPIPNKTATPTSTSVPPTPIPNTSMLVGSNAIQSGLDNNPPGMAEAFQYTAASSGTVTHLRVYADGSNTARQLVLGLYSNNNGHPGTLLTGGIVNNPAAGAWNAVSVPSVAVTAGRSYWLAILGPSGGNIPQFRDRSCCGGPNETSAQTNLSVLPTTWSTGTMYANSPASLYATP